MCGKRFWKVSLVRWGRGSVGTVPERCEGKAFRTHRSGAWGERAPSTTMGASCGPTPMAASRS